MASFVILLFIIGYCVFCVWYLLKKRKKTACSGNCLHCSAMHNQHCSDIRSSKQVNYSQSSTQHQALLNPINFKQSQDLHQANIKNTPTNAQDSMNNYNPTPFQDPMTTDKHTLIQNNDNASNRSLTKHNDN